MGYSTTYDIVSNSDTVIVFKNPCIVFAEWVESVPSSTAEIEEATGRLSASRSLSEDTPSSPQNGSHDLVVDDGRFAKMETLPTDNGSLSSATIFSAESSQVTDQSIFGAGPSDTEQTITAPEIVELGSDNDGFSSSVMTKTHNTEAIPKSTVEHEEEKEIRFCVCSGNLMSASAYFDRTWKQDQWKESSRNPEDGRFHIAARDWDEEAFEILMNLFHLRNRKVPRTVSLEMLAKIAVIADYYECGESVDLMADIWVTDLRAKTPIPTTYCRELVLWMLISYTFKVLEVFEQVTAVAIRQSNEPVRNLGLPIPSWITEEMDLRRYQATESVVSALSEQLDTYRSATYTCPADSSYSFRCGSMLLGMLTKGMDSLNLETACLGQSFDELCVQARSMKSEKWYHSRSSIHSCNMSSTVNSIVDRASASVVGLLFREGAAWAGSMN